jgi:hypothetical protein
LTVRAIEEQWNHRRALRLSNGAMEAVLLPGGGSLAELRLAASPNNCLWAAPWLTADPGDAEFELLVERYGSAPAGEFLAGYTGHALCLDIFGPPSPQEAAHGIPLHGEAAVREWSLTPTAQGCVASVNLPAAQLVFERNVSLVAGAAVLQVRECVENLGAEPREIHWVQHLSLGPPLLARGESSVHASLDRGLTWPQGYEGHELLRDNAAFDWPQAPLADGGALDLRTPFARNGYGFVAAARVPPGREIAFIAALNFRLGLALIYCFRRRDFPWVAIWEENCARPAAPWKETAQVRGMEFGTTPMPLGRDAIRRLGPVFDTPGSLLLEPGAVRRANYLACIAAVPSGWRKITDVVPGPHNLTLVGPRDSETLTVPIAGLHDFFLEGDSAQ